MHFGQLMDVILKTAKHEHTAPNIYNISAEKGSNKYQLNAQTYQPLLPE